MAADTAWPKAATIESESILLEPIRVRDAADVAEALDSPELHRFIGGEPASVDELTSRFAVLVKGESPDGSQAWLNWVIRDRASSEVVGTVQATLFHSRDRLIAEVAWVVAVPWQGKGRAKEAAGALFTWLWELRVDAVIAHVHPEHQASVNVARSLGMSATDQVVDGEVLWERKP